METLNEIGWTFWLKWISATVLGFLIGIGVMFCISESPLIHYSTNSNETVRNITLAMFFVCIAAATGILQYAVLNEYIDISRWWIGASVAGWLIALALLSIISNLLGSFRLAASIQSTTSLLLCSVPIAFTQWLVLRRPIHDADWWIVANAIGLLVSSSIIGVGLDYATTAYVTGGPLAESISESYVICLFGPVSVIVFGAITGLALVLLLRRPIIPTSQR